jgi:AcrR family transcriptional regulator
MEDVAVMAKVGTATVYRYFSTKAELAIQSATLFWKSEADKYLTILEAQQYDDLSGIQQVETILKCFGRLYANSPKFLKFLQEFDSFVKTQGILTERLKEYEETILDLKPYFTKALVKGTEDGSIALDFPIEAAYFALTHTMLSLMQKLALNGDILDSDNQISSQVQIDIIVQLFVKGLEKRRG